MRRMFYDIETIPNIGFFWRPGYKLQIGHENILKERSIICICWKWEGDKKVHSLEWDHEKIGPIGLDTPSNDSDKAMLVEFAKEISEADEVVAHNGDRFDMPWIKGRCLKHGIDVDPFSKSIDTLAWAKRMGFNSNRLDYLGKYLLGEGKIHTDYDMWKQILVNGCPKTMNKMIKYCKRDVELLERVYNELVKLSRPKTHAGVLAGGERWHCAHCGSKNVQRSKRRVTAAGSISHQMKCVDCGKYHSINDAQYRIFIKEKK